LSLPVSHLRPGDLVEIRSHAEILATLDNDGTLDGVVFMAEMLPYIGQQLRVFRRLEKTCVEGSPFGMGEFHNNDVVFLHGVRCTGASHDNCARSCMIFWKEAWLTKVVSGNVPEPQPSDPTAVVALTARLHAPVTDGKYFCQSTNLVNATRALSGMERLLKVISDVRVGTYSVPTAIKLVVRPTLAKIAKLFTSRIPITDRTKTPKQSQGLQPGDLVEVKSIAEISATLDANGQNRGLQWSFDLARYSNKRFRVARRLEHIIVEYNGKMMKVSDTVLLEGAFCPCKYVVGGCPRADLIYWREIWLRKIDEPTLHKPNLSGQKTSVSSS
jgi:hypothetical protein